MVIAIVDSGVDAGHPDLAPVDQAGIDLVDGDSEPDDPNGLGDRLFKGGPINTAVRAAAAPGVNILSTAPTAPTTAWPNGTGGYAWLDGTSMAAPHAAGVAALLAARGVTGTDAIDRIIATATPGDDPRLGAGLVNAAAAVSGFARRRRAPG